MHLTTARGSRAFRNVETGAEVWQKTRRKPTRARAPAIARARITCTGEDARVRRAVCGARALAHGCLPADCWLGPMLLRAVSSLLVSDPRVFVCVCMCVVCVRACECVCVWQHPAAAVSRAGAVNCSRRLAWLGRPAGWLAGCYRTQK